MIKKYTTLIAIIACMLCLLLTQQQEKVMAQNMRTWPAPPFPKEWIPDSDNFTEWANQITKTVPLTDYQALANGVWTTWQNYAIYLIVVFVVPIVVGLVLWLCTYIVCCCGCCCKNKIMTNGQKPLEVTLKGGIPYVVVWLLIVLCTIVSLGFFIYFVLGIDNMRKQVFPVAQKALASPETMKGALENIPGIIPNISKVLNNFLDEVSDFNPLVKTIFNVTKGLVDDVNGIKPFLDNNSRIFQNIQDTQERMANASAGANVTIPVFDFSAFTSLFGNSSQLLGFNISSQVDNILGTVNSSLSSVEGTIDNVQDTINTQFDSISQMINGTLTPVKQQIDVVTNTILNNAIFIQVFGEKNPETGRYDKLDEYDQYSLYTEIGVAIVIALLLCVSAIVATFGFLCVCIAPKADKEDVEKQEKANRCNCCCICCLCCFDCYTQTTLLFFAIISGLFLLIFFLSSDVCTQAPTYGKKTEESMNLPPLSLPSSVSIPVNVTIPNISFADAVTGFLQCPEDGDILSATGLNFETFGVVETINAMAKSALGNVNAFNISQLTDQALGSVNNLNTSVALPSTAQYTSQLSNLTNNMENLLYTFYANFPLFLEKEDFAEETAQFNALNTILMKYNIENATAANIYDFAPLYYDVNGYRSGGSTPVPGKLSSQGGNGALYNATVGNVTVAERNQIYGSMARKFPNLVLAPGLVQAGLVFNLTRLNAKEPWQVKYQFSNLNEIKGNISLLEANIQEAGNYITGILNLKSRFAPVVDAVKTKFDGVVDSVPSLITNIVGVLSQAIENEDALNCNYIGTFYNETTSSYCGNVLVAMGGTSITIICAMFVFFIATVVIYWSWILHEKLEYGDIESEDYDD